MVVVTQLPRFFIVSFMGNRVPGVRKAAQGPQAYNIKSSFEV